MFLGPTARAVWAGGGGEGRARAGMPPSSRLGWPKLKIYYTTSWGSWLWGLGNPSLLHNVLGIWALKAPECKVYYTTS